MGAPTGAPQGGCETAGDGIPLSFSRGLERLSRVVLEAAQGEDRWLERIRSGLVALLGFLDQERNWASLLVLQCSQQGTVAAECARDVHDALGEVFEESRAEVIVGAQLAPSTGLIAELVVSAVVSLVRARMLEGDGNPLTELGPALMSFVVEPYLARGAMKADLAGAQPPADQVCPRAEVIPIRPDSRHMQALRAIAATPHRNNREIGIAIGVEHEGNVRRLLRTLEQRGLIENTTPRRSRCEPNAWLLTLYGERILEVISRSFTAAHQRERREPVPKRATPSATPLPRAGRDRPARKAA